VRIEDILQESCVLENLESCTKEEVLAELVEALRKSGLVKGPEEAVGIILDREKLGSTGIGEGVAIPHGKLQGMGGVVAVFGRSLKGVEFDAVDGKKVSILFLLLAPEGAAGLHLKILSRISRVLRDASFRSRLMELPDGPAIYAALTAEDRKLER
jgi:PTS system nitrogen regulatory IIA component